MCNFVVDYHSGYISAYVRCVPDHEKSKSSDDDTHKKPLKPITVREDKVIDIFLPILL